MTISNFFTRFFKRSYYADGDKCASGGSVQEFVNQFNAPSCTDVWIFSLGLLHRSSYST